MIVRVDLDKEGVRMLDFLCAYYAQKSRSSLLRLVLVEDFRRVGGGKSVES